MDQAETKGDDAALSPPDEKAGAIRHALTDETKEIRRQLFEGEVGPLMRLQVEREEFVDDGRGVLQHLHLGRRALLGGAQLSAQIFPEDLTEAFRHVFLERREIE